MEKTTVTIEIKQEVSITLLWIVAGVLAVSIAFLLPAKSTELWSALNAGGIAAAIYLVALLVYVLRSPLSLRWRAIVAIVSIVVLPTMAYTWIRTEDQSRWQAEELMKVREVIGKGIRLYYMPGPLLKTLAVYYEQGQRKKETLADVFRRLHKGVTAGSNIYKPVWEGELMKSIIVETLEPERVVLVSQETYVAGRNPAFKNYNGQTGMVQDKFILTPKGITYESEN
jgi:hypothetical protein